MLVRCSRKSLIMSLTYSILCTGISDNNYNLPRCIDLDLYWVALEQAILHRNETIQDFNLYLGLLFVKASVHALSYHGVNLELSMKLHIPHPTQKSIKSSLEKLAYLMNEGSEDGLRDLYSLHEGALLRTLPQMNPCNVPTLYDPKHAIPPIDHQFRMAEDYIVAVLNINDAFPSPADTDICVQRIIMSSKTMKCDHIIPLCIKLIKNGTKFGYALTARLIQAMFIRYTTRCYIISEKKDEELIHQMCAAIFLEAKSLVGMDYLFISLLAQQIGSCVQNGYIQFLNSVWLQKLLELQDRKKGCFWNPQNARRNGIDICDDHLTGSMIAALSYTVRYLLKRCYI